MVGRGQVKVDSTERFVAFGLAENNRDLLIERNPMAKVWTAVLIGLDRLLHQRKQRTLRLFRRLIQANDVLLEGLHGFCNFGLKRVNRHGLNT